MARSCVSSTEARGASRIRRLRTSMTTSKPGMCWCSIPAARCLVPLLCGAPTEAPCNCGRRCSVRTVGTHWPSRWRLNTEPADVLEALLGDGEPIRYSYVPDHVPLEHYQTVYATVPGSVETPSAGRHLTWELLNRMRTKGVRVADIVLHCTISSMQDDDVDARKPLIEEWFRVDERAAEAVNTSRRVIAVGTTVIRALESTVNATGVVQAATGWTDLVIRSDSRLRAVDGLLTGLHEPPATHLDILRAVVDADLLERAYAEVRERGYLWHEFGDAMLIA